MENLSTWRPDPESDSYKLGSLAMAVRLFLISGSAGDRKLMDRLAAEVLNAKPINR